MKDILWLRHHNSIKNSESLGKQIVNSIEKHTTDSGTISTEIILTTTGVKIK